MYEVLALSMEIEEYPKRDVERVVLSLSDFGNADYETMMYSGAYLTRFDRKAAALKMYRQSSRIFPERAEPYVLGLKLAKAADETDSIQWAVCGVLRHCWTSDYVAQQQAAEDLVAEHARKLRQTNQTEQLKALMRAVSEARQRDLHILLEWNGTGDLDLFVEEPGGSVCSFEMPLTPSGGIHLHDGSGPDPENCHETYVCPEGFAGPYRVSVRKVLGNIVGNRARLTITTHQGSNQKQTFSRTLVLENGEAAFTCDLDQGRRTTPRTGLSLLQPPPVDLRMFSTASRHVRSRQEIKVMGEFAQSRQSQIRQAGAFGFAPNVQLIPEGTSLRGQAIVSHDRRYVRIAIQPVFTNVTDIFTFSFVNAGP